MARSVAPDMPFRREMEALALAEDWGGWDTARLVFADWLEENGHDAEAAFARLTFMRPSLLWQFGRQNIPGPGWMTPNGYAVGWPVSSVVMRTVIHLPMGSARTIAVGRTFDKWLLGFAPETLLIATVDRWPQCDRVEFAYRRKNRFSTKVNGDSRRYIATGVDSFLAAIREHEGKPAAEYADKKETVSA